MANSSQIKLNVKLAITSNTALVLSLDIRELCKIFHHFARYTVAKIKRDNFVIYGITHK